MVAGGVWTCRWRELRPIAFGGTGKGGDGVGMGIGVGGGGYEMVGGAEEGEGVREGGR